MKGKLLYERTVDALQILVRLAEKDAQRKFCTQLQVKVCQPATETKTELIALLKIHG